MADEIKTAQTRDERINELLEKSAKDAVDGIKGPSLADQFQAFGKKDGEDVVDEDSKDIDTEETSTGGKKIRIPASRFKTITTELKELRTKVGNVDEYQERIATLEAQIKTSKNTEDDLPDWWKQAYGDTDISRQGYKNQQRIMREELNRSLADMERQREQADAEREERIQSIEDSFDNQMQELEDGLGRELTASQKSEILDIVGEYSPQDNGKYIAYLPIDKAYEIYQKTQGQSQSKRNIADIAGMSSTGSGQISSPKERPQMGDWRKRFNL